MEKMSKTELLRLLESQKDKLSRYEGRLRDVVAAYKSLSKEKEALEASFRALTSQLQQKSIKSDDSKSKACDSIEDKLNTDVKDFLILDQPEDLNDHCKQSSEKSREDNSEGNGAKSPDCSQSDRSCASNDGDITSAEQLRIQLATLTNSLSTLSAEKSRMEAGFQADKKKLRQEKEERENLVRDLQKQIQQKERLYKSELEALKSKLIVERHEREKEHSDHGAMIMELQKLLTEERNTRDQLEATILPLKSRAVTSDQTEKLLQEAHDELEATKDKLIKSETAAQEASPVLLQLQLEMSQLKQQHTVAIQEEQKRALKAEERARQLVAVHEERVASLESRLAELSETVGSYDRLRQADLLSIQTLKEHLARLNTAPISVVDSKPEKDETCIEVEPSLQLQYLLVQLSKLKEQIQEVSLSCEKPIDVEDVFCSNLKDLVVRFDSHLACREEKNRLLQEIEQLKSIKLHTSLYQARNREGAETETLRFQVRSLQERVRMLNSQLEQMESTEQELRSQANRYQQQMETEKLAWQEKVHALESELRSKALQTEQQLALQRENSLALLEDKEQEIRTLKSSFQMFLPNRNNCGTFNQSSLASESVALTPQFEEHGLPLNPSDQNLSGSLSGILLSTLHSANGVAGVGSSESPHILHYAHELARREVDISNLRKVRNKLESDLRDLSKILAAERERHCEETLCLRESIARLERCQSREGANLEYLKNVVISLLESDSPSSKRHMLNAIAAVLRFSEAEMSRVTHHSSNSWWYNAQ